MTFINPKFCILFSITIFAISFFMPSIYYHNIVGEKNVAFLNIESLFYYSACILFLIIGIKSFELTPKKEIKEFKHTKLNSRFVFLILLLCNTINILITYNIFYKNKAIILSTFISGSSAQALMGGVDLDGSFSSVTTITSSLALWCYYQHNEEDKWNIFKKGMIPLSLIISIIKPLLFMNRVGIMGTLSSYAAIFLFKKYKLGKNKSVFLYASIFMASVILIFLAISFLRASPDNSNNSALLKNLFGYTIVPYSHLSALVSGDLRYNNPGFGYYILTFLRDIPGIGFNIENFLGWQPNNYVWLREFQDTWHAGLNGDLIWLSSFGYVFVSLGWSSPIYFFLYGFFSQAIWRNFVRGGDLGIILYPWVYFCMLFSFGPNMIASKTTLYLMFSILAIKILKPLIIKIK